MSDGGDRQAVLAGLRALTRSALADPAARVALHLHPQTLAVLPHLPVAWAEARAQLGQEPAVQADASLARYGYAVRPIRSETAAGPEPSP